MTIGESQDEAVTTAPEPDDANAGTVDPSSQDGNGSSDEGDDDSGEDQEQKLFTQEELDKAVQKRLGIAQRKWERDQATKAQQPAPVLPKQEDFRDNPQGFFDAMATYKAHQIVEENKVKERQAQVEDTYVDREDAFREKVSDFRQVVAKHPRDGGPAISDVMLAAIKESELGPEIAYHLGKNPDESYRIYGLSAVAQAKEIGKIEAKLTNNSPEVKKVSNAPEPINPVGSRAKPQKFELSDPKSVQTMGPSNWIKQRNADIAKRNKA